MSLKAMIIRFPDGGAEFYWESDLPSVGDTIGRRSGDWVVSRVEANLEGRVTITVTPAEVVCDESWPEPHVFSYRA